MKRLLRALLLPALTLSLAGTGFAAGAASPAKEEKKAEATEKKEQRVTPRQLTGEVTSVDPKGGTLTVKAKTGEKSFTAEEKAKGALEKIKVGDRVRVRYVEKEGKLMARSVAEVKTKGEAKGMAEGKPKGEAKRGAPAKTESKEPGKSAMPSTK
jgi:ribosomal protein S1